MQRDEKGQFVKGGKGGPGRPKKKREERYYQIALSAVSFKEWRKIIKKAAEQAARGDATARRFLADYLVGKPGESLDITSGGEPLDKMTDEERIARLTAIFDAARARRDSESSD